MYLFDINGPYICVIAKHNRKINGFLKRALPLFEAFFNTWNKIRLLYPFDAETTTVLDGASEVRSFIYHHHA